MQKTTNLSLNKPDYGDIADIQDINDNMDIIDSVIKTINTSIANVYSKSETYSQSEINNLVGAIPKFSIKIVSTLPTTDISDTTVYLLKTSETETDNLYTEYIYIGGKWEMLGTQKLDLSNYYKSAEVDKLVEAEKTERQNADAVESTRAEAAEKILQSNIDAEATTREEADKALETKISDTDSKKVGYQEVQGNTLYMYSDDTKAVLLATLELPAAPVQDVQINGSSIVTDGVATIPRGNDSNAGVVKSVYGYGLQTNNNYQLYGVSRSTEEYKTINNAHVISKGTLTNIQQSYVDGILCSTDEAKALTTEQQIAARERIGATTKSGWTKVATVTDPYSGDILNLEGYDEIYVHGNLVTSDATWMYFSTPDKIASQIHSNMTGTNVLRTIFVHLFNTPLGVDCHCKYYGALNYQFVGNWATAYASFKDAFVADITKITFQYPDYVTTLSLDVYAK